MPQPKYGARDGLEARLTDWAERLSRDKTLPWIGLGMIADLKAAAAALRGEEEPDEFADFKKPVIQEFDL